MMVGTRCAASDLCSCPPPIPRFAHVPPAIRHSEFVIPH